MISININIWIIKLDYKKYTEKNTLHIHCIGSSAPEISAYSARNKSIMQDRSQSPLS